MTRWEDAEIRAEKEGKEFPPVGGGTGGGFWAGDPLVFEGERERELEGGKLTQEGEKGESQLKKMEEDEDKNEGEGKEGWGVEGEGEGEGEGNDGASDMQDVSLSSSA